MIHRFSPTALRNLKRRVTYITRGAVARRARSRYSPANYVRTPGEVIMSSTEIRILLATAADAAWIVPLAPRLHDFGPPPWRSREVMDQAVARVVDRALTSATADAVVLAAVDAAGRGLGFVRVHT